MHYYKILLDIPNTDYYLYSYSSQLQANTRVLVNLRNRIEVGVVYQECDMSQIDFAIDKIKLIHQVLVDDITIDHQLIDIAIFLHTYYIYPLGATFMGLLPNKFKSKYEIQYTATKNKSYSLIKADIQTKSKKLLRLIAELQQHDLTKAQIKLILGSTYLTKIDYLLSNQHIIETIPKKSTKTNITAQLKTLTIAQQSVYTQINISSKPTILYGITGSGKTEIYLQLVLQQLQKKKQVLILYPEINLTPMLRSRFDHAFPDTNIIILNSQVTNPKRLEYYQQIKDGHAQIIMGTRLSLFSPFCNLGLIIVDEEHDNSFKQEDNLPYHARNIAVWLANRYRIPIVLGSATPSLESLYNYKVGKYNLVKLETRATDNAILPKIELIDSTLLKPNNAGICYPTLQAIQECIDRKQMCLIYINRRGYAPVVICNECNHIIKCINCNCNMVLHGKNRLLCHYCGYQNTLPSQCPSCNQNSLSGIGTGTQNIEEFITTHFSNSNILRIDRDNTSSKHAWDDIYTKLNHHKVDIIIGTQMLAKGHDFANLSLVVCVDVDNALYSPSYNAITQMYSTLTQVSGRAGRADNKGRVIIQTRFPQEKIFSYLKAHDFLGWVNYILNERKQFHLPPYSHQAKIKFQSSNELDLATLHTHIMSRIIQHKTNKEIIVYSPVFDAMAKINNIYHSHMLIQSNLRGRLHNYLVTEMLPQLKLLNNKLYFKVDIDFIN